jgi:uncharacterized membrane protein
VSVSIEWVAMDVGHESMVVCYYPSVLMYNFTVLTIAQVMCNIMLYKCEVEPQGIVICKKPILKSKGVITFAPMNYSTLTLFPHELSTITFDPIKLPFYDIFPHSVSQRD